jgi:hypothetical protein
MRRGAISARVSVMSISDSRQCRPGLSDPA